LYKINATQQRQTFAIHVDDTESGQNGSDVSAVNLESSAVLQPPFNASLHQTERISIDSPGIKGESINSCRHFFGQVILLQIS